MSEVEQQAPEEEAPPEEETVAEATEVDLPEGWVLVQDQPEQTVILSETQGETRLQAAILRAEKQINGQLISAQGETPEQLQAAAEAIEANVASLPETEAAPLEEAPTTATRMAIDNETGEVSAEEVEVNPNSVITEDGSFTEEEWAARNRNDTIVTEEGQVVYSGAGANVEAIDETLAATAEATATAENEATAEVYASEDTKQVIYDTSDSVDSPGQSAGGTLIVPADANTLADASRAMDEASQAAENERVTGPIVEPLATGASAPAATPAAVEAADELGVDLETVEGTGTDGKITKTDVEAAAASDG